MAVFRIEKTRDYTVMSNHHLKNKNLTLKAKGLLSVMLSLPETWDYTLKPFRFTTQALKWAQTIKFSPSSPATVITIPKTDDSSSWPSDNRRNL